MQQEAYLLNGIPHCSFKKTIYCNTITVLLLFHITDNFFTVVIMYVYHTYSNLCAFSVALKSINICGNAELLQCIYLCCKYQKTTETTSKKHQAEHPDRLFTDAGQKKTFGHAVGLVQKLQSRYRLNFKHLHFYAEIQGQPRMTYMYSHPESSKCLKPVQRPGQFIAFGRLNQFSDSLFSFIFSMLSLNYVHGACLPSLIRLPVVAAGHCSQAIGQPPSVGY